MSIQSRMKEREEERIRLNIPPKEPYDPWAFPSEKTYDSRLYRRFKEQLEKQLKQEQRLS